MDRISPQQRSRNMQHIRCSGTSPEKTVRQIVCNLGFRHRYRLNCNSLPGRPDLVFPARRQIIFVHGCFWHSHHGCKLAHIPSTHKEYWGPKLQRNRERHRRNIRKLRAQGFRVLVLWECDVRSREQFVRRVIAEFLCK